MTIYMSELQSQEGQSKTEINQNRFSNSFSREALSERKKETKEREELVECTFSPQIRTRPDDVRRDDIITKTKVWQQERERQIQLNEVLKKL